MSAEEVDLASKNEATLHRFYSAFAIRDVTTMISCYADDAQFSDEGFPDLRGKKVGAMWSMLLNRPQDPKDGAITDKFVYNNVHATEHMGFVHWEIKYWSPFKTNSLIHNKIDSTFEFNEEHLIVRQIDSFDFYTWSQEAFGCFGAVCGWNPCFQWLLQYKTEQKVNEYVEEHPQFKDEY